jgi:hypothetical protein
MKEFSSTLFSSNAKRLLRPTSLVLLLCGFAIAPATAQLITLTPSNVIGSSPWGDGTNSPWAWNAVGSGNQYQASTIFSQQTGSVSGLDTAWTGNTWFPSPNVGGTGASKNSGYVVIDLGAAYYLSSIELFNGTATYQHTGTFDLLASNSIINASDVSNYGQILSGPTLLGSTSLPFADGENPVTGHAYYPSSITAYRYLQINISAAGSSGNIQGASLSEVRFTGISAIPEPSTYAAMAGAAMLGFAVWRRRNRRNSPAVAPSAATA